MKHMLWLSVPLLVACAAVPREAPIPAGSQTTVVSLAHSDCASCGEQLAAKLRDAKDIYRAAYDRRRAEITIVAAPNVDTVAEAKRLSEGETFEVVPGAGHGSYIPWQEPPPGADVQIVVRDGRDLPKLEPVLASGKVTVVDFSATWCEPCRKLDEHMLDTATKKPDVAYRKLDIVDWDSPLAQRWLKQAPQLPYVLVFDKRGGKVATISGLDIAKLDAAVQQAENSSP